MGGFFVGKIMDKLMKTVGIIGGLGPETTNKFCLEIINFCLKNNKNQRPPMLIWNVPMPIKVERDCITKNIGREKFLPFLIEAAIILEKAGVEFLVIPCNTAHIFIKEVRSAVRIPVLSIIDETLSVIKNKKISHVGLLATSMTINNNLFEDKLRFHGIKQITPTIADQSKLNKIIHNLVMNKHNPRHKKEVNKIIAQMVRQKVKNIVLACTDLQLITKQHPQVEILDTMHILAKATAKEILKGEL